MLTFDLSLPSFTYMLSFTSPFATSFHSVNECKTITEPQTKKRSLDETVELIEILSPLKKQKIGYISSPTKTKKRSIEVKSELKDIDVPSKKQKIDLSLLTKNSGNIESTTSDSSTTIIKPKRKRKITSKKANPITGRRGYLPNTAAPCFTQSLENKTIGECDEESIRQHAYLRIQVFAILLVVFCGMAIRTDPTKLRSLLLKIQAAYLQAGKATNSGKHKYDAAHFNPGAGLCDDIRNMMMEEINSDLSVTPLKKRFLIDKGFTEEDFEYLKNNKFTPDAIKEIFNRVWPACKSIIFNTETDEMINGTTEMLKIINLSVDKALEKVLRPRMLELLASISEVNSPPTTPCAEFDPLINATKKFHETIENFFTFFKQTIDKLCKLLHQYDQEFQKLDNYTHLPKDEIIKIIENLFKLEIQLYPRTNKPKSLKKRAVDAALIQISESSNKNSSATASAAIELTAKRIRMPKNDKFLKDLNREIYNNRNNLFYDPTLTLTRWWTKRADFLKEEISKQKKNLEIISKYVSLELKGSQLPQDKDYNFFKALFGKESLLDIQKRLLKPISNPETPTTPKAKTITRKTVRLLRTRTQLKKS
jgi:hypothetical protein